MPPPVVKLLHRCLEKERRQRLADISDARLELEDALADFGRDAAVLGDGTMADGRRVAPRARAPWRRVATLAVTALLAGTIVGVVAWRSRQDAPLIVTRVAIGLPSGEALDTNAYGRDVVITPDGTRVIFITNRGSRLYVRPLDQLESTLLASASTKLGLTSPFVSPDSQWVGFNDGGVLKKVPITGGQPVTLVGAGAFGGATWGVDGTIVFASAGSGSGLHRVSDSGGKPSPLTKPAYPREFIHAFPEFLPSGQAVIYTILTSGGIEAAEIAVLDLRTGRSKVVLRGGSDAQFASSGHLVYGASGSLHAVPFDPDRLEIAGSNIPVVSGVVTKARGIANFSVARNGTLLYVAGPVVPGILPTRGEIVTVGRDGHASPLLPRADYKEPRISPDGTRLAVSDGSDIWLHDLRRHTRVRLTSDGSASRPVWMPDGSRVIYRSAVLGEDLFSIAADGSARPEPLLIRPGVQYSAGVSPDGSVVAFDEIDSVGHRDIGLLPRDGRAALFIATLFGERGPRFSRDSRWIAYVSDESGRDEVYLQPYPGPGPKVAVSVGGGTEPVWSPAGDELFYRQGRRVVSVSIKTAPSLVVGPPNILFEGDYAHDPGSNTPSYDVFPDSRRFVMIKPDPNPTEVASPSLVLIQNWFEELKRQVPIR
jgi:serine/threonine-protein kinase